ncbi:PAS domain-containing hybrid sensor histidine kinase/response regulator [Prosthecomicrobium pneumaticum]|uniref:histidine kinase n=1 Tax=Prosthecomicrobium pneumaticum TaxID=81895 RepID=A0A7W9CVB9_9HYPH|nr:hybrid sensor histidine kinase/response regulator [Prosthecomicrobium pneumaticum]MBB5752349.1 Na+/proline symporter/signal transduction histidine kinase [Prosthecomicrobium pneumaticum]
MLQGSIVVLAAILYIGFLFLVASYGDRARRPRASGRGRPFIYALSLSVYCTSWTFFGSVGLASRSGLEFLTIYLGPALMIGLFYPLLRRLVRLAKAERITSIADFIGARYGKSYAVAGVVALIAVVGIVPYIALQLKAISTSFVTLAGPGGGFAALGDVAFPIALALAAFSILFGTRHADATEHQEGLMLAIATESLIKLVAFLAVGLYVTYGLFDGFGDLAAQAAARAGTIDILGRPFDGGAWLTMTLLSFCAIVLLPRQFHVTVVENNADSELRRARWLLPSYLVLINLFVVPIALAGLVLLPAGVDADTYVVALPMAHGAEALTLFAFVGGLSAATAMVIVECVALSIMISNDVVMPLLLRHRQHGFDAGADQRPRLLLIRRAAILLVMLLAYGYYKATGGTAALASIGLLSFAAIAQFAPAFFGGLVWRRATGRGAIAGMLAGFAVWLYTLMLPAFAASGWLPERFVTEGPFGLGFLRPEGLLNFSFEPLTHGVVWSLSVNILAFVLVSLARGPEPSERVQATIFVAAERVHAPALRLWRTAVTVRDLEETVARFLGAERTGRSFAAYARERGIALDPARPADLPLLRFAERLLASAIGAASSRLVLSLLIKRRDPATKGAVKLLDDASAAIQYNRDLLQTAIDQVSQGIAVFDRELKLICWNRPFRALLDLPPELGQVGIGLDAILRHQAAVGAFGPGPIEEAVASRLDRLVGRRGPYQEVLHPSGTVLEVRVDAMPDGGIVATFADITERVKSAEALERARDTLEKRVQERTEELVRVNEQLVRAKAEADEANLSKTRFLAAAGHDILQPLNAARLYTTSLVERFDKGPERALVGNIDSALEGVEEIIGAVLDISRLDAGALKPEIGVFALDDVLRPIAAEFDAMAREKGVALRFVPTSLSVRSDRRLLRRVVQNLVSNAVKYTASGRVLLGARRRGETVVISVYDTGLGIPASKQKAIFREFHRLDAGARAARGLGLGLSIVERIARVLKHRVRVVSEPGRGSHFSVELPRAEGRAATIPAHAAAPAPAAALDGLVVLALDNEPQILAGTAALLGGWGCHVITALSADEAVHAAAAGRAPPDVLLVDYHLDTGNGLEAIGRLRSRFGSAVPAALVTADRTPAVRETATAAAVTVINKPVKPAALRAFLARSRALKAAAE